MSTILVVDDMAICREPIAEALRQQGYDTICAADGAEALSILRDRPTDLVLLDVNMPGLGGLEVLRSIRRNPDLKQTPVVLLTDRAEREIVQQAAEHGAQGYLLKSQFSFDELLARVEVCLGRIPVASSAGAVTKNTEGSRGYSRWRSNVEVSKSPIPQASRSQSPAKSVVDSRPPQGPTANSDRANPPPTARSVDKLTPVITRADLIRLVTDGLELRPLGPTVHNVIAVAGNASCSADDVAKAVCHDQALCIRLLKLANSSAYSRGRLVDSVKEAIQRIGIQEVRSLVMTLGVFEQFQGAAAEHVDPHLFWEHSIACGLVASTIAKVRRSKNSDDYFLWGMLHDVGRLILLEHASDQYASVWDAAEELGLPLEAVESKIMLLDHCHILERALEHWQFPRDFSAPVVHHHHSIANLKRLRPDQAEAAATVALANRIIHALLIGSGGNEAIYSLDDLVDFLDISPQKIAEIVTKVPDEANTLKYTMLARAGEGAWPDFASQVRSRIDVEFRPRCVSSEPELDAFRMFCERIAVPSDEALPNIGIIYLRDANELPKLTATWDAAEGSESVADTPIVLIVAKGRIDTNQPWLASRRHAVLSPPIRIPSFLATIQQMLT